MKYGMPVILLVLALMSAGCGQSADRLYTEGKALVADPETIDRGLAKLLAFDTDFPGDPRAPEVLLTIAGVHQARTDFTRAIETYETLFTRFPGSPEEYKGRFLLAYLYYDQLQDTARAAALYRDFITAYPDSELTASARILLENIDRPIDQWPVIRQLSQSGPSESAGAPSRNEEK